MGRIQSDIGLITGIPISETVNKLMAVAGRRRDLLVSRTDKLKEEQLAITELSGLLISLKLAAGKLDRDSLFNQRQVSSSDENVLSARVSGTPPLGVHQFTVLRTAQSQQFVAQGLASDTEPLGGGRLTFRFGDHLQRAVRLDQLGGGRGMVRGRIRITDRSGASAEIDLSAALTVDDVLKAINNNGQVRVTATTYDGRIRLIDHTGQTVSNLIVEEVGNGTTAASLGLAGIDVAASTADGDDVFYMDEDLDLDALNDGTGVGTDPVLPDIRYQLRDGTSGQIDLSPIVPGSSDVDREATLGEVLERLNAAAPGKLKVEIAADGKRLVATDLTTGSGTFQLEAINGSPALEDLGLDVEPSGGQLTGRRILGGLRGVLLSSLDGGRGLGSLGLLQLTDRSGATDTVDLSAAETVEQVIEAINAAQVGIVAEVNQARNGIQLTDTTGASASHLIVASGDGRNTAERLQLAIDADVTSVSSGDLHLQIISHATPLEQLNGGAGIARGKIRIVDSEFGSAEVNLADDDIHTVGDVIRAINRSGVKVVAELNETGDGIRIRDLGSGAGPLSVTDIDSHTAADLHIAGQGQSVEIDGRRTQVIDGSMTYVIELDEDDSLRTLRDKINDLDAGLSATVLFDGSSRPYRLLLASQRSGRLGQLVVDGSELGISLQEAVPAADAVLVGGDASTGSGPVVTSPTNTFSGVLPGVTLEAHAASPSPVTITVSSTDEDLVGAVEELVNRYNKFREKLEEYTRYDPETETASVLTGDGAALRLDSDLSYLFSGRIHGAGPIQSLAEVGIEFNDDGTLTFDSSRLKDRYAADPEAVRRFFTEEEFGLSARLGKLLDQLAEDDTSLLAQRLEALDRKIQQNEDKVAQMNERLEAERERLLRTFYRLETVVAKLQDNLNALSSLQVLPPLVVTRSRR